MEVLNTVTGGTTATTSSTSSTGSSSISEKRPPMAQLTPAQEQKISQVVIDKTGDADLNKAILEAKPTIEGFLKLASCQTGGSTLFAGRYTAPDASHMSSVIPDMQYKSLNHCVTVTTISDWKIESRSRLDYHTVDKIRFQVGYVSEASNEAISKYVRMVRGDDGQWYVKFHDFGKSLWSSN